MPHSIPEEQKEAFNRLLFDLQNLVISSKSDNPIELNNALELLDMTVERLKSIDSPIENIENLFKNIESLKEACSHQKWDIVQELNEFINKQIFDMLS